MRKKLLTTLALLLMAVSGARAQDNFYLDISSDGKSATLMYGGVPAGNPYFGDDWNEDAYSGDFYDFKENTCTAITVHESCQGFDGASLADLFKEFKALTTINNLGNLNTTKVKNMSGMFWGCSSLTTLDLSSWNTSKVTNMGDMFNGCSSLTTLDLSSWNTSNVTNMEKMFEGCSSLTTLTLDPDKWDTSKVESMGNMFEGCSSLTTLDLSSWNTSNVTNMGDMFNGCSSLTTLKLDPDKWDTSKVTNMLYMFYGCKKLTTLDLSGWNTSKVTNMCDMFAECNELTTLTLDPDKWDTSNVTNMAWMFEGCSKLTTLDLSGWNTSKVTNMNMMFFYCEKLETIYVGDGWSANVNDSEDMFVNCPKLTNWKSNNPTDNTHAHTGEGGYLTFGVAVRSDGAGSYWATYYNGTNSYTADANTKVYQAKVNNDKDAVVLTEVTGREIPAGKAVVLKSSASPVVLTPLATPTQTLTGNELLGTDAAFDTPANAYCLSNETTGSSPRGVGFYLYTPSDGAKIPAHRAYLVVTGGPTTSRGFLGFGDDDDATAIDNGQWKIDNSDGSIYDLSGRIVTGHPRKGIYVKNGKLVVIK